ncbi:MAG: hypothetical protein LBG52_02570 [Candidatus Peribacteria bacterium]|jgi:predicted nucleic acid-binding protein|nr:hypothetical protein [Candidatus Peribacteria bacterium]
MLPLKYLIDQYSSIIKRGLAGILFLVMILMIRTIINYQVIIDTTDAVKRKTTSVQTAMEYSQNFQAKYLASDYGHFFLAHDNNTLFPGERIISFKT